MRTLFVGLAAATALACLIPIPGRTADEDTVARAKEMLRRTQEALRQAQADNADLARAKAAAEQKLEAANKQVDAAQNGSKAAQSALQSQLKSAQGGQAELQQRLAEVASRLAEANSKAAETAKLLSARDAELGQVRQSLEQARTADSSCEDKNLKLYGYAEEVLERYKNKGVWASLSQKEPVFGLKEVGVENVVQEYRLKFAGQKIKP